MDCAAQQFEIAAHFLDAEAEAHVDARAIVDHASPRERRDLGREGDRGAECLAIGQRIEGATSR